MHGDGSQRSRRSCRLCSGLTNMSRRRTTILRCPSLRSEKQKLLIVVKVNTAMPPSLCYRTESSSVFRLERQRLHLLDHIRLDSKQLVQPLDDDEETRRLTHV